ncbi:MAG: hypothetical protein V3U45_08405 [bacterium]
MRPVQDADRGLARDRPGRLLPPPPRGVPPMTDLHCGACGQFVSYTALHRCPQKNKWWDAAQARREALRRALESVGAA